MSIFNTSKEMFNKTQNSFLVLTGKPGGQAREGTWTDVKLVEPKWFYSWAGQFIGVYHYVHNYIYGIYILLYASRIFDIAWFMKVL